MQAIKTNQSKELLTAVQVIYLCYVLFTVYAKPKLFKKHKWSDDMFGPGCRCSMQFDCHSDSNCHHHYGLHYKCVLTCCGTRCTINSATHAFG